MTQSLKNKQNFKKGSVEMMVLHLLATEGDCHGYRLRQLIKEGSNGVLIIPEGSMYPTLHRLVANNYITSCNPAAGQHKAPVYYHLEAAGKDRLAELIEDYKEVNNAIEAIMEF